MDNSGQPVSRTDARNKNARWWWIIAVGCLTVVLLGILIPRGERGGVNPATLTNRPAGNLVESSTTGERSHRGSHYLRGVATASAEEIVATKLSQFARNRRQIFHGMAKRYGVDVPSDVERFFEAAEGGNWD